MTRKDICDLLESLGFIIILDDMVHAKTKLRYAFRYDHVFVYQGSKHIRTIDLVPGPYYN